MSEPESEPKPITQDYGSSELNTVYANLDGPTKAKFDKIKNEKIKINLLKDISNPELNDLFNSLPNEKQKEYEEFGIRDKYTILKEILKNKKEEALKKEKEDSFNFKPPSPEAKPQEDVINKTKDKKTVTIKRSKININEIMENAKLEEAEIRKEKGIPEDLFEVEEKEIFNKKEQSPPQILFDNLVKTYYASNPHIFHSTISHELEVRFGTKGIKKLIRSDYDNVIKKLKSLNFNCINESGNYTLKIQNEFLDKNRGVFEVSNIRT